MFTLTPAMGRDYKSRAAIKADLLAGKDFVANSYDGSSGYINLEQLREMKVVSVNVRYKQLRSVAVIKLATLKPLACSCDQPNQPQCDKHGPHE